jgi:hypothetical protein
MRGDWELVDVETDTRVEVTISPALLRRYAEELANHTEGLRAFCVRQGMGFVQVSSADLSGDRLLEDGILTSLRVAGVLG